MKLVILDAQTYGDDMDLSVLSRGFEADIYDTTPPELVAERIRGAGVVVTNKVALTGAVLAASPVLRLIAVAATGTDNVDLETASRQGIAVANVPGYSTASVAAHTFAMYFHMAHHMAYHVAFAREGGWSRGHLFTHLECPWHEPVGQTWGIVGLGAIGRAVALRAEAFGFKVIYHSTSGRNLDAPWPQEKLHTLLSVADVVSLHAPLNADTTHLISAHELALMKSRALLINTSRGALINETDLAIALDGGAIAGAAVDVMAQEPPPADHPFFSLREPRRLTVTPHIAGLSVQARARLLEEVRANIDAFLEGTPRNLIRDV